MQALDPYYEEADPEFTTVRKKMKEILQMEEDLSEIVQLVGKDSLNESDKITLEIARIMRDDFLQQNGFSKHDYFCPFYKTIWMMKCLVHYYNLAQQILEDAPPNTKITWNMIKDHTSVEKDALSRMKFLLPADGEQHIVSSLSELFEDISNKFRTFYDNVI